MHTRAVVGTNPTGELITSGFLVTRAESGNRRVPLLITLVYRYFAARTTEAHHS